MANTNIYNMTDTWNNAGVVFTAIQMNVTDTASDPTSKLLDLQLAGSSIFNFGKNGNLTLTTNGAQIKGGGNTGFIHFNGGAGIVSFSQRAGYANGSGGWVGFQVDPNTSMGFSSAANLGAASDAMFWRDAAGAIAQQNGTNAQAFRAYNTWGSAANNEWFGLDWQTTVNVARLRMVANGTGTARPIAIDAFQKAGAAVAGDIPTGTFAVVRDTSGLTTKLIYNNAGTLMTVALA